MLKWRKIPSDVKEEIYQSVVTIIQTRRASVSLVEESIICKVKEAGEGSFVG